MALKVYTSVARVETKSQKVLPPAPLMLNRVKVISFQQNQKRQNNEHVF